MTVRQVEDGVTTVWPAGTIERLDPLVDLLEVVMMDVRSGQYRPTITPKKYGFQTDDEYWDYGRRLAGLGGK